MQACCSAWRLALALQVEYAVEWPLHLVLTRDALASYSRLFALLWATTRTQVGPT